MVNLNYIQVVVVVVFNLLQWGLTYIVYRRCTVRTMMLSKVVNTNHVVSCVFSQFK